jgi:hypothetical protein
MIAVLGCPLTLAEPSHVGDVIVEAVRIPFDVTLWLACPV